MNRFLATLSVLLFSTLSVVLLVDSSVSASHSYTPPLLTQDLFLQLRGKTEEEKVTTTLVTKLINQYDKIQGSSSSNYLDKEVFHSEINRALKDGAWGKFQHNYKDLTRNYTYKTGVFVYQLSRDCDNKIFAINNSAYRPTSDTYQIVAGKREPDCAFRMVYIMAESGSIVPQGKTYYYSAGYQVDLSYNSITQLSESSFSILLLNMEYTFLNNDVANSFGEVPKQFDNKLQVKFPLRIFSVANKSQGSAEVNAFLDTEIFDKFNPGVPYPSMYSVQLFNSKKEELPGTPTLDGASVNKWQNVPYGEYRVLFVGYYTGDNFDRYVGKPSVVDIRVTEDGFHYLYDPNKEKFCFFKNGISSADVTLTTVDPNTGSWLSPGSAPTRCIDQDPWDKDLHSEISASYNLEEIPPCNTLDLACHITRAISTITGWISQFFMWLFVPNSDFVSNNFKSFLNNLQNSLGFLWTPVSMIQAVYTGIIDNKISGDTCALPQMTLFGSSSTIHLCAWRYQFPQLWQHMQLAIQGGLAVSFVWALYRLLMKFFSIHIEDHDDDDDGVTVETHADVSRHNSKYVNRQRGGMLK